MTDAQPPRGDEPDITSVDDVEDGKTLMFGASDRIELIATLMLAIATVLTAWSAFESSKWSGHQSINFSQASAARVESTRADTRAGQQAQVDIAMFIDWVTALNADVASGAIPALGGGGYEPTPGTLSGFLYLRFREEFRPALDAWIATDPVDNPDAPSSPFVMVGPDGQPVYRLTAAQEADVLEIEAEQYAQLAREANQNSDNYVLTIVLFASVLFFAGISGKLVAKRNRILALGVGVVLLLVGCYILLSLPILTLNQ